MSYRNTRQQSRVRLSEADLEQLGEEVTVQFMIVRPGGYVGDATGFVISADEDGSWILTNRHVVRSIVAAESRVFYAADGQSSGFRVLDVLPDGADLAIVESSLRFLWIPRISWRKHLVPGERLYMFGYPLGRARHAIGSYSSRQNEEMIRDPRYEIDSKYVEVMNIRSAPGASGSAVLDAYGEVVGVLSKGPADGGPPCYAVPIPYVRRMLRDNRIDFLCGSQPNNELAHTGQERRTSEEYRNEPPRRPLPGRMYEDPEDHEYDVPRGRPSRYREPEPRRLRARSENERSRRVAIEDEHRPRRRAGTGHGTYDIEIRGPRRHGSTSHRRRRRASHMCVVM